MLELLTPYIAAPLIGGIIGYIINDKPMHFRPHTAKYIFGMTIPFNFGMIPMRKGRISESISSTINKNLMNKEVMLYYLLLSVKDLWGIMSSVNTNMTNQVISVNTFPELVVRDERYLLRNCFSDIHVRCYLINMRQYKDTKSNYKWQYFIEIKSDNLRSRELTGL